MKKLFLWLTLLIVFIAVLAYSIVFSKFGNELIASYIENKVNNPQQNIKFKVTNFRLRVDSLDFNAVINENSNISVNGALSIWDRWVDLKYDIKITDLSILNNLINQNLKSELFTNGVFKGDYQSAIIQGFSNIANSETKYNLVLKDFKIKDIFLELKNAKIDEFLNFMNKPHYLNGDLTINANIKNIDNNNLDGKLIANISKGQLENDVINKEFNQTFSSKINIDGDIEALFLGKNAEIKTQLLTSIGNLILEKTLVDLEKDRVVSDYKFEVKNLQKLESVLGRKLIGDFNTTGNILYENAIFNVDGKSDIFESSTVFRFKLEDNIAKDISFKVENTKIEKLLDFLNEPIYATGDLNVQGEIQNSNLEELSGTIISKISDAKLVNEVVNAVFKQELKTPVNFDMALNNQFIPNKIVSQMVLNSSLANLSAENAIYDLVEGVLKSDYLLKISSLDNLKDFTKTKLRGKLDIKGELEKKDMFLFATGKSSVLGGKLDFTLKNDDLTASLNDVSVKELSYMMYKPEFFNSRGDFSLNYNTITKQGNLVGKFFNGSFLPNDLALLINHLAKFDLTKEIYETVDLNSDINDNLLTSNFLMKSENTQIESKEAITDFDKNFIDAKLNTQIKNRSFNLSLMGEMNKPKISLGAEELLKNEIDRKLEKNRDKIEEKLNKVLDGEVDNEKAKELLKNIFR
jgi:hypothetical protein